MRLKQVESMILSKAAGDCWGLPSHSSQNLLSTCNLLAFIARRLSVVQYDSRLCKGSCGVLMSLCLEVNMNYSDGEVLGSLGLEKEDILKLLVLACNVGKPPSGRAIEEKRVSQVAHREQKRDER